MFKLFSKSEKEFFDFSLLKTDMHSHLLPGIDDGSPNMESSLKLIEEMHQLGFNKLITTPHIMWDMYKNTRVDILEKLELVKTAVKNKGLNVELHAAAEYYLDEHVAELLKNKEPLLTISGKMLLCEFSLAFPSHGLKDILFEMQMQGYMPIIAHPERYVYLERNKVFYEELKDIGCLFQLNILALSGQYGKVVQDLAEHLAKNNYYDFIGTDLHHFRHLNELQNFSNSAILQKLLDSGRIQNSLL